MFSAIQLFRAWAKSQVKFCQREAKSNPMQTYQLPPVSLLSSYSLLSGEEKCCSRNCEIGFWQKIKSKGNLVAATLAHPAFCLPYCVFAGVLPLYQEHGKGFLNLGWCNRWVLKAVWSLSALHCCNWYYCCYSVALYCLHLPGLPNFFLQFHSNAELGRQETHRRTHAYKLSHT